MMVRSNASHSQDFEGRFLCIRSRQFFTKTKMFPKRFLSSKFDLVVEHNLERTGVSTQDCESTDILWCGDLLSIQLPRTHSIRWSFLMICFQRRSCVWKQYLFFHPEYVSERSSPLASCLMVVVSLRGSSYPFFTICLLLHDAHLNSIAFLMHMCWLISIVTMNQNKFTEFFRLLAKNIKFSVHEESE